jgi:tetratricopeptide (TPR) repeat protein
MTTSDQSGPDETMIRIGAAIALRERGDRASARRQFQRLWAEIGAEAGDPFHRCAIAHSMADVQDDVDDELRWDLRALAAAKEITDERAAQGGLAGAAATLYPSLHLNLGECYRKLGDFDRARDHLRQGLTAVDYLADDGYAQMIRIGLDRLSRRLID